MWNRTGTISVTQGSRTITGAGVVDWLEQREGWEIVIEGEDFSHEIDEITSSTTLELVDPVLRGSDVGLTFKIKPTQGMELRLYERLSSTENIFAGVLDDLALGLFAQWQSLPGNENGTSAEFIASLKGDSAFQVWEDAGNTGSLADFLSVTKPFLGLLSDADPNINPVFSRFSSGESAVGISMVGGALKYMPFDQPVLAVRTEIITYEISVEYTTSADTGSTNGFGFALGAAGSRSNIFYFKNGGVVNETENPSATTSVDSDVAFLYSDGDIVKLLLHFYPNGKAYVQRVAPDGTYSPLSDVTSLLPAGGEIAVSFRRYFDGFFAVKTYQTDVRAAAVLASVGADVNAPFVFNAKIWDDPLSLASVTSGDDPEVQVTAVGPVSTLGVSCLGPNASSTAGVYLDMQVASGDLIKATFTRIDTGGTPAVGIGFGNTADTARGVVFRTSGQAFGLDAGLVPLPSSTTASSPPSFDQGDEVEIEARLSGGSVGNYEIEYYVRVSGGERSGPHLIGGVTDLNAWVIMRSEADWTVSVVKGVEANLFNLSSLASAVKSVPAWVSTAGSDSNLGSEANPFATVQAAILAGFREVIVSGTDFDVADLRINGDWWVGGHLEVRAAGEFQPRARGGDALTGFVATVGRTNVYEVALTSAPVRHEDGSAKGFVFVKDVPFSLISDAHRHPAHRGRSHRCPHWIMFPVQSLNDLEVATEPSWFYDSAAAKLHVNAVPGADPLAMEVVVPRGNGVQNLKSNQSLTLINIGYEFVTVSLDGVGRYYTESLWSFGGSVDGLSIDLCGGGVDIYSSIIAASNDCINVHNTAAAPEFQGRQDGYSTTSSRCRSIEPYLAYAFDDCRSIHEGAIGSVEGGLAEYGGSTGFAPASGAEETIRGTLIRNCGWENSSQAGISVTNAVLDDGNRTVCYAEGVIIEGCSNGFQTANASSLLTCVNTQTHNCTGTALDALAAGSTITARNHTDIGTPTKKGGAGTVVIENTTLVT